MKLRSIQALRGIAALLVMLCHLRAVESLHADGERVFSDVWINGTSGVDIFFVISGFVIVWVTTHTPRSFRQSAAFLFGRITRIYPLWWLFAAIAAAYFMVIYNTPWDAEALTRPGFNGLEHLWKSALLLPQPDFPVLIVGWTLIHEMYFYIVFAGIILIVPKHWRLMALLVWAVIIVAGSLFLPLVRHASSLLILALFPMTLEFILGALIAYAIRFKITAGALPCLFTGVATFGFVFLKYDFVSGGGPLIDWMNLAKPDAFTMSWGRTIFFGIPAGLIVYGLVAMELRNDWGKWIPSFMVKLGDWSYALYLCHILVLSAVAKLLFPYLPSTGLIDNIAFVVIASGGAILLSGLTYHLFEQPLLRFFALWRSKIAGEQPST
ncbi:MAG: acyltransferase [Henriciella sp.]